ncbi:uncharacterized protein ATC70_008254 [Mucor velutinosus]|uniref:Uncharacterized protein n=1 Tax=Mucor velutinosus TaxID=708070 RepID=A0AAN7DP15_9FUNG|nr:hypothetical protein ATC70_008254 [Mucor velutinosus]
MRLCTKLVGIMAAYGATALALEAIDINDCPQLPPRERPTSVHDLRVDDIKVIAAMGDSVSAGMLAKNINSTYISMSDFIEYRGVSWTMGGDPDAPSIAKYVKHFSPDLYGASVGQKPARLCPDTFFCLDAEHTPEIDVLNAAQSGATSKELPDQVEYLIQHLGQGTELADKWKMINVFIGFNDASVSCMPGRNVTEYRSNVKGALEQLIEQVDYAFINLIGMMHYNDLVYLTDTENPSYRKRFENDTVNLLDYECYCCRQPYAGTSFIGDRVSMYNQALSRVAEEVSGTLLSDFLAPIMGRPLKNIAVVYQPMNTLIPTVPYNSLSNVDGYHPNVIGYSYLSRELWNQMFLAKNEKLQSSPFDAATPLHCPSVNDRLKTYKSIL